MPVDEDLSTVMATDPVFGLPALLASDEQVLGSAGAWFAGRRCAVFVTDRRILAMRLVATGDEFAASNRGFNGSRVLELPLLGLATVRVDAEVLDLVDLTGRVRSVRMDSAQESAALAQRLRESLAPLRGPDARDAARSRARTLAAHQVRECFEEWARADPAQRRALAAASLSAVKGADQNFSESP
ncbi:MAG TPA: hypothetical protein H9837_10470 [Candidatus Brachybacterium merdigallinarum]|nr:hypothetical protein [Candidatus Brachybacterium merdigallinarum]